MAFVWFLGWVPAGLLAGWMLARLARLTPLMRFWIFASPVALVLTFGLTLSLDLAAAAIEYQDACSGWGEKGSHPCSRWDYVTQDFELTIMFVGLFCLPGTVVAMASRVFFGKPA